MPETQIRRLPNLFHLLIFLALTVFSFLVSEALVLTIAHSHPLTAALVNQKIQLTANAVTYILCLSASALLFPSIWERSFPSGIRWSPAKATPRLALAGLSLGFISQGISNFLPAPNKMPIEDAFRDPGTIWFLAAFGILLAPLFEEVLFRGFLLPGLAIVFDWVLLPRGDTPDQGLDNLRTWQASEHFTSTALVFASLITSLLFALIHAPQLGKNWAAIGLLAAVSLILCFVRIRTNSVAASTLVHATYNLSVFVSIFIATSGFHHLERL
jgi:membrane protease YdiL (CAAX protease family)